MKLSIVIPAHNEELNLPDCVRELQEVVGRQHHINYEIIIVDDNSQDNTADVIRDI